MMKKYMLGRPNTENKIVKVLLFILIPLIILLSITLISIATMILLKNFSYNYFSFFIIIGIIEFFIMTVGVIGIYLNLPNEIIIENEKIISKSPFKDKEKRIGNLSDIMSFSKGYTYVYTMKDGNVLFKFPYHGIDNNEFIKYLSDNYNEEIYIEGNTLFTSIFYWLIMSILIMSIMELPKFSIIIVVFLMTYILYIFILELRFEFKFTTDKIFYKKIFQKEFKLTDFIKVVEKKENGYGRYKLIEPNYTIHLYRPNKKTITVSNITKEQIGKINKILRNKNIKVIKKNFK